MSEMKIYIVIEFGSLVELACDICQTNITSYLYSTLHVTAHIWLPFIAPSMSRYKAYADFVQCIISTGYEVAEMVLNFQKLLRKFVSEQLVYE